MTDIRQGVTPFQGSKFFNTLPSRGVAPGYRVLHLWCVDSSAPTAHRPVSPGQRLGSGTAPDYQPQRGVTQCPHKPTT